MLTAKTLKYLAAATAVLFAAAALIGSDRDVLWIVDDLIMFALAICVILLIVVSAAVLTRSFRASRQAEG